MTTLDRRQFLKSSLAGAAALGLAAPSRAAVPSAAPAPGAVVSVDEEFIDANVYIHRWPFRQHAASDPATLAALLRARGVTQAWTGSFEAPFHKNLAGVNARLAADCRDHGDGILIPFGSVNPLLPDWRDDLRRCAGEHGMRGLRVFPGYHNYTLDNPAFAELARAAADANLLLQVVCWMYDERHHSALFQVPTINPAPLGALLKDIPTLRVVVLNAMRGAGAARRIHDTLGPDRVAYDFAMMDSPDGVGELLEVVSAERVLFGSYAPFFYFEAAALKLDEAGVSAETRRAICAATPRRLLGAGGKT